MSYFSRIAVPSFGGSTDQYALYEITFEYSLEGSVETLILTTHARTL